MNCDYCHAPKAPSMVFRGQVRSMEEGDFCCAVPHLCPAPDLPPANETWFRGHKPRKPEEGPKVAAPPPQRRVKHLELDG